MERGRASSRVSCGERVQPCKLEVAWSKCKAGVCCDGEEGEVELWGSTLLTSVGTGMPGEVLWELWEKDGDDEGEAGIEGDRISQGGERGK
ncbi:hypothetical protein GOP47_0000873 [Adiantum capillus-veneris]|uniref:Uncharacterized protein n=1 Tax=Adiantum capillus-veneris TaxID=13818 RepID=A0A9D4VE42_ADICA|nr:hypothetical protein GOP47_0000873 [Adiantum capillus-veneris]